MKTITKDLKSFKIIPENKTTYGASFRKSLNDEVTSIMTDEELEVMPLYILEQNIFGYNTAKATCDDNDEFDEEIGIGVVSAKLDRKNHLWMAKNYERALRDMNSAMRKLEDLCGKHLKKAKAIENDLENYYGWRKK